MKANNQIEFDATALKSVNREADILGNVLAEGARLISVGKISKDVVEEKNGSFALCLLEEDSDTVRELKIGDSITVGRAASPNQSVWTIADKWLSKAHFTISVDANGLPQIEDCGSLNGTFVNDHTVSARCCLVRGSCIRAGHSLFLFI